MKGEKIWFRDPKVGWIKAYIEDVHSSPRSYWIKLNDGTVIRRNSNVIRKLKNE